MKTMFILFTLTLLNLGVYAQNTNHGRVLKTETGETDNATVEMTWYEDGYVKTSSRVKCTSCHGSGKCWSCGGSGKGMMGFNCPMCFGGSGTCTYCHGAGVLVNVTGSYQNDKTETNSGGGTYKNGKGTTTNRSTSSTCKYCGGGGGCASCKGTGHKYNSYSHREDTCPTCRGNGRCFNCRGTGRQR